MTFLEGIHFEVQNELNFHFSAVYIFNDPL